MNQILTILNEISKVDKQEPVFYIKPNGSIETDRFHNEKLIDLKLYLDYGVQNKQDDIEIVGTLQFSMKIDSVNYQIQGHNVSIGGIRTYLYHHLKPYYRTHVSLSFNPSATLQDYINVIGEIRKVILEHREDSGPGTYLLELSLEN
ncbi:MAG: hypothetical protein ACI9J3_003162 [Parvicellaceae bacterium]|jgi:hypothetical protein